MASTKLTAKARAAFSVLAFVACDLARHEADQVSLALDLDASGVRLSAVIRGDIEKALAVAEELREAAERRGHRLLGGAGFDLARTGLEPDQQRLALFCPVA
jgi:hypothetical protein